MQFISSVCMKITIRRGESLSPGVILSLFVSKFGAPTHSFDFSLMLCFIRQRGLSFQRCQCSFPSSNCLFQIVNCLSNSHSVFPECPKSFLLSIFSHIVNSLFPFVTCLSSCQRLRRLSDKQAVRGKIRYHRLEAHYFSK